MVTVGKIYHAKSSGYAIIGVICMIVVAIITSLLMNQQVEVSWAFNHTAAEWLFYASILLGFGFLALYAHLAHYRVEFNPTVEQDLKTFMEAQDGVSGVSFTNLPDFTAVNQKSKNSGTSDPICMTYMKAGDTKEVMVVLQWSSDVSTMEQKVTVVNYEPSVTPALNL